jgi:hypothetical protein
MPPSDRDNPRNFRRLARRAWPSLRAVLLLAHVIGVLLLSLPGAYKLGDRARWKRPRTQRELGLWTDRLSSWGWSTTRDELDANLWRLTQRYLRVQQALVSPFEPYSRYAGTNQTWGMFKSPPRQVYALRILVHDHRGWSTVYLSRSPTYDYLSRELDHNRFRKQVGMLHRSPELMSALSDWAAARALHDFPAADRVRIDLESYDSLSPEQLRRGDEPQRRVTARRVIVRGASP